jgi:hypothetical protein
MARPQKWDDQLPSSTVKHSKGSAKFSAPKKIAYVMGLSIRTVLRRCKEIYGVTFEEIYQRFSLAGLASLRRSQFNLAKTNASMAIFLGKVYLGQSDRGYSDEELAKAIAREMTALGAANGP